MGSSASIPGSVDKHTLREAGNPRLSPQDRETVLMIVRNCFSRLRSAHDPLTPSLSMRMRAQSVVRGPFAEAENNPGELLFYARDLFFEAAGESDSVDMHILALILDELLGYLHVDNRALRSSARSELREAVILGLVSEVGLSYVSWDEVETLVDCLIESTVRYPQLFERQS